MANKSQIAKSKLDGFISRYYLGGLGKSVVWTFDGKNLVTEFASENRTMKATVVFKNLSYPEEFKLGIFDTEKFIKLTSVLGEDCGFRIVTVDGEAKSLDMQDERKTAHFMLSSIDMIPPVPKMKELPKADISVTINKEFIDDFVKSAGALSEVGTFTVTVNKDTARFTIGYTSVASNSITVEAELARAKQIAPLTFPTTVFKEIFSANKGAKEMSFEISEKGLAILEFDCDDYKSTYYAVRTEEAK